MDNNVVIWPAKPKYKVVIADRSNRSKRNSKVLSVGCGITSSLAFYCEYNKFYVLKNFKVNPLKIKPLETRLVLNENVNTGIYEVFLSFLIQ